jgi:hypothetical protein
VALELASLFVCVVLCHVAPNDIDKYGYDVILERVNLGPPDLAGGVAVGDMLRSLGRSLLANFRTN